MKFPHQGGIVEIFASQRDDGFYEFQVEDHRIGIDEDNIERVFAPFGQVVTVEVNVREGIGLVLSIVHQLLELENGRICLNSRADSGAIFALKISFGRVVTVVGKT